MTLTRESDFFLQLGFVDKLKLCSQSRLSAVHEDRTTEGASSLDKPIEGYFEMVTPPVKSNDEKPPTTSDRSVESSRSANTVEPTPAESFFAREEVVVRKPAKSALSSLLASSNSSNPFSDLYSAISGRGVPAAASTTITIFFPRARAPAGKPMLLNVRKDATMEEVLGFALWNYWEEGWEPRLDEEPEKSEDLLSAVGWVMRIAEDDGEVDEDFPRASFASPISSSRLMSRPQRPTGLVGLQSLGLISMPCWKRLPLKVRTQYCIKS